MKNNLIKSAFFFIFASLALTSCEEDQVVFDGSQYTAMAAFNEPGVSLPVAQNEGGEILVQVDVTNTSDQDRTIDVSVDESSSALATEYTIDSATLFIPAGSYNGYIRVVGNFEAIPSGTIRNLILNLDSVEGAVLDTQKTQINIELFRVCPVAANFMIGNYLFEELTEYVDGPALESGAVLAITGPIGTEAPTVRHFMSYNYPDYCNTKNDFTFNLVCGEILIPATDNNSNCSCGATPAFIFGPPTENGTYDPDDDTEVIINFTNDVNGNCSPAVQTSYRLTKQP